MRGAVNLSVSWTCLKGTVRCRLAGVPNCSAYLDDLVAYSSTWSEDMPVLATVFQRVEDTSLTLNLAKYEFGKATVMYLGKQVGEGHVCSVEEKNSAIKGFPAATTRQELRRFLGMAGYNRSFCKIFLLLLQSL